jgi:Plasma-membrane choline transporter
LEESSELDDAENESQTFQSGHVKDGPYTQNGIKSSWRDDRLPSQRRARNMSPNSDLNERDEDNESHGSSLGKGKMVDVGLDNPASSKMTVSFNSGSDVSDDDDAPIQQFRRQPEALSDYMEGRVSPTPRDNDKQALLEQTGSAASSIHNAMDKADPDRPAHDAFWGHLFVISLIGLFATAFLVYLHTAPPSDGRWKLVDTIYTTIHKSYFLLGIYTLVSVLVSLLWLALLRAYVRVLAYGMIIAVPVILYSFSLYPFISSFRGSWGGQSIQDRVMRWGSIIPFVLSTLWIYAIVRNRHSTGKAISILEFACRVLASNPALLALGLATLIITVSWTWLWMIMFTRIFLGGQISSDSFVISVSSWWLGIYFILVYLWSLGIIAGIQRAVTAATVSQWYFHRLSVPAPTSAQVVRAAVIHAVTTLFGSISLFALIVLLLRLPLMVLHRRIASVIALFAYSLIPSPIAALVNPLTLTYSAIHSQPLAQSARGFTQMAVFSSFSTTGLYAAPSMPRGSNANSSLLSYRLSKMVLHACRFAMSLALGFGGWVTTARNLDVTGNNTFRGSLYAYIIGLIAGTIGWGVLGSMENVLACIVDSALVCWASEVGNSGREATYCREAEWLFRDDGYVSTEAGTRWNQV